MLARHCAIGALHLLDEPLSCRRRPCGRHWSMADALMASQTRTGR
ncbi:hypothetical protein GLE_4580 [Lysobacter enzymogenes]|uniref:Uncharacterized protein n=1 Tax=Lysobacter enzymogenes TaxID=69 RepID=A0A0S2DN52_LYSEN|nr:hypothetical protein GLE_4580 [Lysobacter enzymogenes]